MEPKKHIWTLNDNIGYIALLDSMGADLLSVNAARVSFDRHSNEFSPLDEKLFETLMMSNPRHSAPFRHAKIVFRFCAPVAIARQFYKHVVGIDAIEYDGFQYSFKSAEKQFREEAWNEKSGRYVTFEPTFYTPKPWMWRRQAKKNKQASVDAEGSLDGELLTRLADAKNKVDYEFYQKLLAGGVAREQARFFLPQSMYVEWYWTMSLQAALHFMDLRDHKGAQHEAQLYGKAMEKLLKIDFPESVKVYRKAKHEAPAE